MEQEPSYGMKTPSPCSKQAREIGGSAASSTPSSSLPPPSVTRLWRPAAQRNLRNQWSKLSSLRREWSSSSSAARSHATSLVNAYLNQKYMATMELGTLSDMRDIRNKASSKLFTQQEVHRRNLLSEYKNMVSIVTQMVKTSKSMRCYLKGASSSPLVQFSGFSEDKNDPGDGGGIPVFSFWSVSCYEKFADELVQMLILELKLKRFLVLEFLSASCEPSKINQLQWSDELYSGEFDHLSICNFSSEESPKPIFPETKPHANQETLEVYLTTWLSEAEIDAYRVDEIFSMIGEEMHFKIS